MKTLLLGFLGFLLFSCSSQEKNQSLLNASDSIKFNAFTQQKIIPGRQESKPYIKYTLTIKLNENKIKEISNKETVIIFNTFKEEVNTLVNFSDYSTTLNNADFFITILDPKGNTKKYPLPQPTILPEIYMP